MSDNKRNTFEGGRKKRMTEKDFYAEVDNLTTEQQDWVNDEIARIRVHDYDLKNTDFKQVLEDAKRYAGSYEQGNERESFEVTQERARQFTAAMDSLNMTLAGFGAGGRDLEREPVTDDEIRGEIERIQRYYPGTEEDMLRYFELD